MDKDRACRDILESTEEARVELARALPGTADAENWATYVEVGRLLQSAVDVGDGASTQQLLDHADRLVTLEPLVRREFEELWAVRCSRYLRPRSEVRGGHER